MKYISVQIRQRNALFFGEIYTAGKKFAQPPVAMVVTNFKSACMLLLNWYYSALFAFHHAIQIIQASALDMVYTVDMVYNVEIVYTVDTTVRKG